MKYIIECKVIVPYEQLHQLDQTEGPPDRTEWECDTEEQALDEFHSTHPIKVLDDFEIKVSLCLSEVPDILRYWSVDEVAECLEGISTATYQELWSKLLEAHPDGKAKPLGGDGSDGTFEEPVITSGSYASDLAAAWSALTDYAKEDIVKAAANLEKKYDE